MQITNQVDLILSSARRGGDEETNTICDLHEAEKYYQKAIEQAEQDGYVEESHHEARHRVREKLNQKYGKGDQ